MSGWSRQFSQEREENFNFRPRTATFVYHWSLQNSLNKAAYRWLKRKYGGRRDKIGVIFKRKNRKSFARLFAKTSVRVKTVRKTSRASKVLLGFLFFLNSRIIAFSPKSHTKGLAAVWSHQCACVFQFSVHVAMEYNAENILVNFIGRVHMYEEVENEKISTGKIIKTALDDYLLT